MALSPGSRVADRYRITGALGTGGMGVVYRAHDERLGRYVAIKMLSADRIGDARARVRLMREARSAAGLEHPSIAQVFDVGETSEGDTFLVMELVRGQTLRELIRAGALSREEVLDIVAQVADALDHAHHNGVIHRDIKPDNVMVRTDGRAVLLDFGLAKDVGPAMAETVSPETPTSDAEHLTKEGTLIGTLSYLAPEQARGSGVGPRSDQFALAATAYEALAGRLPWVGENAAAVLAGILVDEAPAPSSLETSLPAQVDRVFARALAKAPEQRFESASAFAAALRGAFAPHPGKQASAPSEGPPARERARPGIAIGVSIVTILIAAGFVASLFWPGPPEPAIDPLAADASIGCPPVIAHGIPEPSGWLGAMVGDLACSRVAFYLGGERRHAVGPAELLELPRTLTDDFPEDPYVEGGARERALQAARSLGAWIDGDVTRLDNGHFDVRLRLETSDAGDPLAEGHGTGAALFQAVGHALDEIVRSPTFPRREAVEPTLAPWIGTDDVETAVLFEDLGEAALAGVGVEETCRALAERRAQLHHLEGEVARVCERFGALPADALDSPALDRSAPATLALTAPEHLATMSEPELRAIADELAQARIAETRGFARAALARGEIAIWEHLEELDRARDLLVAASQDHPQDWFLRVHLVRILRHSSGETAATRALAAWNPASPEAWRTVALPLYRNPERALPWLERAYLSGGALPMYGIYYADMLLRLGERSATSQVLTIAARYSAAGPRSQLAGSYLGARVNISQARFARALENVEEALNGHDRLGRLVDGDLDALSWTLDLAQLLGRGTEIADPLAVKFVLEQPHRLIVDQPHYELPAIGLCMTASRPVAQRCLARLQEIRMSRRTHAGRLDGAAELLDGARAYVNGDYAAAASAWRPLVGSRASHLRSDVFVEVGDMASATRIEAVQARQRSFAGAHPVHVVRAERAMANGDEARARRLAERVLSAWGNADVDVPSVARMRALRERLGPAPSPSPN